MARRFLHLLLAIFSSIPCSPGYGQSPGFDDIGTRQAPPRGSQAVSEPLSAAVRSFYSGGFEYGAWLGVHGAQSALAGIKSVTYALGPENKVLEVPYGQQMGLHDLAKQNGFFVGDSSEAAKTESDAGFWLGVDRVPRLQSLYVEATRKNGSTFLVGGRPWSFDLATYLPRPARFCLSVTPGYVADPPSSSGIIHAYDKLTGKVVLETLRSLKLAITADPKGPATNISEILPTVEKVEYCAFHTMSPPESVSRIQVRTAVLDKDGAFKIDLPEHPDTRRFGPGRTFWTAAVAVSVKGGKVWTFWMKKTASLSDAVKTKGAQDVPEIAYRPETASPIFIDRATLQQLFW